MKTSLLITFLVCVLNSTNGHSQVLKETFANLDLNPGGVIYDVAYDEYTKTYIVVGDFTSIGGQARNNLAFIDSTFTITANNPITSIDGAIRTVEVFDKGAPFYLTPPSFPPPPPDGLRRYIYIGGDFNLVNGDTLISCCRFVSNEILSSSTIQPYTLDSSWDIEINSNLPSTSTINDIDLYGDTLVVVGDFNISSPSYPNYISSISTYNASSTIVDYISMFENFQNVLLTNENHFSIEKVDSGYIISGNSRYSFFDDSGFLVFNFDSISGVHKYPFIDVFKNEIDTIVISSNTSIAFEGSIEKNTVNSQNGGTAHPFGINLLGYSDSYNDKIYFASDNHLKVYKRDTINLLTEVSSHILNSQFGSGIVINPGSDFISPTPFLLSIPVTPVPSPGTTPAFSGSETTDGYRAKRIKIINNRLFISGDQLVNVDFYNKTGLAVFCLEPENPKEFTPFDTTICEGNIRTYTIPPVKYADGYRWSYSGSGASFRVSGSPGVFIPFSDTIHPSSVTYPGNSIEISFGAGTTGGVLSVQPFSLCNTQNDYLYADSSYINLVTAPLPNISLVDDTMSFTCVRDSFYLISQSTTANTSFYWIYNSDTLNYDDSLFVNLTNVTNLIDSTYFYGYVNEPINGCRSTDSVFFYYDTLATAIDTADFSFTPSVFGCDTDSLTVTLNIPDATIEWDLNSGVTTPSMSSYTIYDALDSLTFYAYATYNINGCRAQQQYAIPTDLATVPGTLLGYSNFGSVTINDSVNCFSPNLALQCAVASGTGAAEWFIGGLPSGDMLNLTQADTTGMNSFGTNTYQFVTTNTSNGCTDTLNATIKFDFDKPFVSTYNGVESLNCSVNSLTLIHSLTSGNVSEGWLDAGNIQTNNDTLIVTNTGSYYYQVQSLANGCTNTDTVVITQSNELLLNLVSDTIICPDQVATILVTPINNNEATTYIWSNGASTQSTDVTGGVDGQDTVQVTVIAQTVSGCIGYDTINVSITPPVIADFIVSSGCLNGNIQVDNVSGGAGNYQYSLDQTSWQSSTVFTGLNFGNYTIYIQDDLGCKYAFSETIDGNSGGLDVNFLVSTYNENGDTLAIVNVSNFTGFDSLVWILPSNASSYSIDDSMVILSILSGGWYDVTLIGYQDTCGYSFTKPVYFGTEVPVFDVGHDTMGIVNLSIYPNPTSGTFTIELEYGTQQNYSIVVTNMQGQPLPSMTKSGVGKIISESFDFPAGTITGPYGIHIISDYDAVQKTIILN